MFACGETPREHVIRHLCPLLGMHCSRPGQWTGGKCLACRCGFSVSTKGGGLLHTCHRQPDPCPWSVIRPLLSELLPQCYPAVRRKPKVIEADAVIALALSDMPPRSLKLALLELAGTPTPAALDMLGVRRENRARVISERINSDAKPQVVSRINSDDTPRGIRRISSDALPQVKSA